MKFTNFEPIGTSPQIEVVKDGYVWDLHNAADFIGYDFNQNRAILILKWDYGCDCDEIIGGRIGLIFNGVSNLEISDKDPHVPRSEDFCMDNISLINENTLRIKFRGGQSFEVECSEVEFDPGKTTGHRA